jgi:hypothetical protein
VPWDQLHQVLLSIITLALVMAADGAVVDIQAGSVLQRVNSKDVQGNLILVIPFVGYIFNVVGL